MGLDFVVLSANLFYLSFGKIMVLMSAFTLVSNWTLCPVSSSGTVSHSINWPLRRAIIASAT